MAGKPKRQWNKARYTEETPEYSRFKILQQQPLFPVPVSGNEPRRGIGIGAGNLPKYQTAESMEYAVELYFKEKYENNEPPTISGMALALGFKSRKSLMSYMHRGEDFSTIIEIAFTRIEEYKNTLLLSVEKAPQGVMFDLTNNHGWCSKSEQTTKHDVGDGLAQLLLSLQGNVLRPILDGGGEPAVDAEFIQVDEPVQAKRMKDDFSDLL